MLVPTSYNDIKAFSEKLKSLIESKGIPLGLDNFPVYIQMETQATKGLKRLMNEAKCGKFLAVLGVDNENKFTVSFLALDKNNHVDKRHYNSKLSKLLKGEETWPKTSITFLKPEAGSANDVLPEVI